MNEPESRFVALALADVKPFTPFVAVMSPMMVNVPVVALVAPYDTLPAVTFPVIVTVPVDALLTPVAVTKLDVMFIVPELEFIIPVPFELLAPVARPVKFIMPVDEVLDIA